MGIRDSQWNIPMSSLVILAASVLRHTGWAKKSDTARTYITLYERYHFFGPPGSVKKQTEVSEKPILATDAGVGKNVAVWTKQQ